MRLTWAISVVVLSAMATAFAQNAVLVWRHWIDHRLIFVSREFLWIGPVGYLFVFTVAAVPAFAVATILSALWPRANRDRLFAGMMAFLGALSLALLFPQIHVVAQVVLAIGLGTRLAALLSSPSGRRLGIVALGLLLTTALFATGERLRRVRRATVSAARYPRHQRARLTCC
jgi:hypothetical protein